MNVIKLINADKWDIALKQIQQNIFQPLMDQKNILHMASIRGNEKVIKYIIGQNSMQIYKADEDGNTAGHLLAENGWDSILLDLVKEKPDFLKLKNNDDKLIANLVISRPKTLKKVLQYMVKYNLVSHLDYVRSDGKTFLIDLIDQNVPEIYNLDGIDWNLTKENPALIYAIEHNPKMAFEILEKAKIDPNVMSKSQKTPLITAIAQNNIILTLKLLELGADVNYGGPENVLLPINLAIQNRSVKMIESLLKYKIDFGKKDDFLKTPIFHLIEMIIINRPVYESSNDLKRIFSKFVDESDLTSKDIDNITPLHLLVKYGLWEDVKNILLNKKLDIAILDKNKNNILSYLPDDKIGDFMALIEKKRPNEPLKISSKKQINLPSTAHGDFGLFNADIVHNIIYLIYIINKYKNTIVPFQSMIEEKRRWEKQFIFPVDSITNIIATSIGLHYDYFYSFLPCILYWRDKNIHYKTSNLEFYIQRAINIRDIRFIILKFSLMPQNGNYTHANIVIYDKAKSTVMRFEPYGDQEIRDSYSLDQMIIKLFQKAIGNKKIRYLRPGDYLQNSKFQTASTGDVKKNLGDPVGYCLAWCYFFLELKLQNPDIDEKTLVETALENIILRNESSENPVLDYIRGYAKKLNEEKDIILREIGFNDSELYSLDYTVTKLTKIQERIKTEIFKFTKN